MPKRILILDDDQDFTGLLRDIYKQSNYDIITQHDPIKALERIRAEHFDLLVTDHRMPGMTGDLLVRELRNSHPTLPVIVISGFLDNDAIRSLIRDGVGGIFMKPLNVGNLLRRSSMLLDEADERAGRPPEIAEQPNANPLPFTFSSYPCLAAKSREFAIHLHAKADFKSTLTVICPPGTPLRDILADINTFSAPGRGAVTLITNRHITVDNLTQHLDRADAEGKRARLAFQNLDYASAEEKSTVVALGTRQGPFAALTAPPELIFAFTHPVDELYERGRLNEALYLLASVTELRAPTLAECTEDIPVFVNRFVREYCRINGVTPELRVNKVAHAWLREQRWEGNVDELRLRVFNAAHLPHGGSITRESFEAAQTEQQWPGGPVGVYALHDYMRRLRDDYVQSALILCENDTTLAARTLGVAKAMLDTRTPATPPRD